MSSRANTFSPTSSSRQETETKIVINGNRLIPAKLANNGNGSNYTGKGKLMVILWNNKENVVDIEMNCYIIFFAMQ